MKPASFVLFASCLCGLSMIGARGAAADAAAGKQLAQVCAGCHGENGVSNQPLTPSLAGEPDDFIQWQLVFFRDGTRKNEIMGPIAGSLTNDDIRNLGAYYTALPPLHVKAAPPDALALAGGKLAAQHRCQSCHGPDFAGAGPAARLAGQREDVMLKALRDFKSGARVGTGVASMTDVVYDLSDNDMRALAHYMANHP